MTSTDLTWQDFRQRLVAAGILAGLGEDGMVAFGTDFMKVFDALDAAHVAAFAHLNAEVWRFPPLEPMPIFELTDYVTTFPQLLGAVTVFTGGDREYAELLRVRADGGHWEEKLTPSGLMMSPAACHPVYSLITGVLPEGGRNLDVLGTCFRREPSADPMRLQSFRMHEFVHVGTPDSAMAHREAALPIMLSLLRGLGLEVEHVPANDPFFGRPGRILAKNQLQAALKFEIVTPVYGGDASPTAIGSANYHEDHFGSAFGIEDASGAVAHSACAALGMERTVLALFARHGMSLADWPAAVRSTLWPDG